MAIVQSTYNRYQAKAFPGMVADASTCDIDTLGVETVAGIGFGLAVSRGVLEKSCILGGTAAGYCGITVRSNTLPVGQADKYADKTSASVMVRGDVWVQTEAAVLLDDPVRFNAVTGQVGVAAGQLIANARYMVAAGIGGLAMVRVIPKGA